ncbi:hypothetical protein [Kordiimonas sp. SCSIO 12610]|uniref:hypothetical protein n=1 Tax=Kordiimonas sp. SCSIO 12610 TaxID=2829597 RepID=UPI0021088CBC|nr:hypothetical protein [Kordiimonas sp. SCSIO 12610]UTW53968.1 hypothetical protein KFF44_08950 [Kordiimonas sp. SCSIO 12610]
MPVILSEGRIQKDGSGTARLIMEDSGIQTEFTWSRENNGNTVMRENGGAPQPVSDLMVMPEDA